VLRPPSSRQATLALLLAGPTRVGGGPRSLPLGFPTFDSAVGFPDRVIGPRNSGIPAPGAVGIPTPETAHAPSVGE